MVITLRVMEHRHAERDDYQIGAASLLVQSAPRWNARLDLLKGEIALGRVVCVCVPQHAAFPVKSGVRRRQSRPGRGRAVRAEHDLERDAALRSNPYRDAAFLPVDGDLFEGQLIDR